MLDRSDANMYTFYQPGTGTYITSHSMQTTPTADRIHSWYLKAKNSAIGSSFAEHVTGGYEFLMRYYTCEDDLYFFVFSRGAYTARFLAEMLDHVGLLSAGNEELIRLAWKTYEKWVSGKNDGSDAAKKEEADLYTFMSGFRETFSRPVRRIRFLGLFDTVNSVPKLESAWMQRSKFPYTARSSAKVIRHAVSIDGRRANFRQDLVSGDQHQREDYMNPEIHRYNSDLAVMGANAKSGVNISKKNVKNVARIPPTVDETEKIENEETYKLAPEHPNDFNEKPNLHVDVSKTVAKRASDDSLMSPNDPNSAYLHTDRRNRLMNDTEPINSSSEDVRRAELQDERVDQSSLINQGRNKIRRKTRLYSRQYKVQDIEEVCFSGDHADIGGGWSRSQGEKWMLSHAPLMWMVNEAVKAGLTFNAIYVQSFAKGNKLTSSAAKCTNTAATTIV